jgi:CubicO group peptidase (beta-lactamase class C family)
MLERVRPESVGIYPASILKYLKALNDTGFVSHNIMLLRHGKVAFEVHYNPFRPDVPHNLFSCSKSIASTAAGFAVGEGVLSLDEKIVDILPEKLDGTPHPFTAAMTVRHLLTMTTAFREFDPISDDWTRDFINRTPDHYPGTVFNYDSMGTHTLCEIVQKRAGTTLLDYLTPRMFEPLGIAANEVTWSVSKYGINQGGGGACMTPEAMAKFGQLYLNRGVWNGKQILPKGWAEEATDGHVSCVTRDGSFKGRYGYKFWRVQQNGFACLGLAGQVIAMHPDKDIVFVGTANGMQTDFHYFHSEYMWNMLYPEIPEIKNKNEAVSFDDAGYAELSEYINKAEAFLPGGSYEIPAGIGEYSGKYLPVAPNLLEIDAFKLVLGEESGEIELRKGEYSGSIPFGYGLHIPCPQTIQNIDRLDKQSWEQLNPSNSSSKTSEKTKNCGSAGVWVDGRTLIVHCQFPLFYFIITCHFGAEAAVLSIAPYGLYKSGNLPCALTHIYK